MPTEETRAGKIAALNDKFRKETPTFTLTVGVQALSDQASIVSAVEGYDTFSEDNDPYGEHDFGSFTFDGHKIFWKIDYYDQALERWEDPLSPQCRRVITVMLASEY